MPQNAWKCSYGTEMPRLSVLGCTKCGKEKEMANRYLKSQETGFVHSVSVTTSRQGVNMNDIAAK